MFRHARLTSATLELHGHPRGEQGAYLRGGVRTVGDRHGSAGSRVTPGGYAVLARNRKQDVAQFTLSDSRTPDEVYAAIRANGQEVVFKNWDNRI